MLPEHFDAATRKYFAKRYHHLPEEFYKKTGLQVVTPETFRQFMKTHRRWAALHGRKPEWWFQELYSCSGRLSLDCVMSQMPCGFSVDYRYGWDLRKEQHRAMVDEAISFFRPTVEFSAPDCRLWCGAKRKVDEVRERAERQRELPALQWLADMCASSPRTAGTTSVRTRCARSYSR